MSALPFDTLEYSKSLRQAGFSQDQAEAMAQAQSKALQEVVKAQELVTKKDLQIALAETKHELLKWIVSIAFAQTALTIGILAFIK